jgi:hypothetical protein
VSGRGLGAWLLRDAMTRTLAAAETIGVRAMLVHAIDQDAARFYLRHGLEASPTEPRHRMILIKDIRPRCGSGASRCRRRDGRSFSSEAREILAWQPLVQRLRRRQSRSISVFSLLDAQGAEVCRDTKRRASNVHLASTALAF